MFLVRIERENGWRSRRNELSPREREVLEQLAIGAGRKEIAAALGVKLGTIDAHVATIYARLGADNAAHAVALGFRRGVLR